MISTCSEEMHCSILIPSMMAYPSPDADLAARSAVYSYMLSLLPISYKGCKRCDLGASERKVALYPNELGPGDMAE